MADISRITLPNGNTYDIKDSTARASIEALAGGEVVSFGGVTTTALTDGGTENPTVNNVQKTPIKGQLYFYNTQEFLWDGDKWIELGGLSGLGALASKSSGTYDKTTSASYTNTNSSKSVSLSGTSSNVNFTVSSDNSGNYQPAGDVSQPQLTSATASVSAEYQPAGTVSQPGFTGTKVTGLTISPASSGTATYTPEGSVSAPSISVKTAGATNNTLKPVTAKTVVNALAAAAPGSTAPANAITYYSVSNETLSLYQIGATTTDSVTLGTAVTVKTGDAVYQATAPTFTGTGKRLVLQDYTPGGTVSQPTFTGTTTTIDSTGSVTGVISKPSFTGTKVQIGGTVTPSGSVTLPTISLGHTSTAVNFA